MAYDPEFARRFGLNLRKARKRAGLSQEEVGFRASLHRTEERRVPPHERACLGTFDRSIGTKQIKEISLIGQIDSGQGSARSFGNCSD